MPLARDSDLHTSQDRHFKNDSECYRPHENNFADSTAKHKKFKHVPEHNKNGGLMQAPRLMDVVKQYLLTPAPNFDENDEREVR